MSNGIREPWAQRPQTYLFAAGVGIIGGLVGTLFQLGSYFLQTHVIGPGNLLEAALRLPWYQALLIPFGGAIAASLLAYGLGRRRRSQGMADVMEAVSFRRAQQLSVRSTIARALSSLALIATGGSVGREGPIVYMSASLGARLGRLSTVPRVRLGLFAGCGTAAGMASAYYAPFGAALFAMEVVLGNFAIDILAPVMVASVVASLVVQGLATPALLGDWIKGPPLYHLPTFTQHSGAEYLFYLALGFAAAGAAWLFIRTMRATEQLFQAMPISPLLRLPLGGLLIGLIGIALPHVWGNGYDAVNHIIDVPLKALSFVALLFVMKIVATSITVGSGGSGGIFTPTMFVGAALGLLLGIAAHRFVPGLDPRPYSIVGMGAVLAATTQAPIMAIFLLFEMTRETQLLLPMMVATITASVSARALGLDSVYLEALRRRGLHVPEGIEETTLTTTKVSDLMRRETVWIRDTATFDMIAGMIQKSRTNAIYVLDATGALRGVVRLHDIKNFLAQADLGPAVIAADLMVDAVPVLPDSTLAEIVQRFDDPEMDELPVTDPQSRALLGIVERRDLIGALSAEVLQYGGRRAKFVEHAGAQHYVEMPRDHGVARIEVPPEFIGQVFGKADFRGRTGLTVLTLVRTEHGTERRLHPTPDLVLARGDGLIVMGPVEAIRRLGGDV